VDPLIQRGIDQLRCCLGEAAAYLEHAKAATGEAAAFHFLLPEDYLAKKRVLRIAFPRTFPYMPPEFSVSPSAALEWPHVMDYGFCLYTGGEQPATGTPEIVVDAAVNKAFSLIRLSLSGSDPQLRQTEFAREIRSYWQMQQAIAGHRLTLTTLPGESGPLYVVSDRSDLQKNNYRYIAAADYDEISSLEARYGRHRVAKRATEQAGYYLKLTSTPPPRLAVDLFAWLGPHIDVSEREKLKNWMNASGKLASRWLILALPAGGVALHTFHLRSSEMHVQRSRVFGRRARRRSSVRATPHRYHADYASIDVLDQSVVHQRAGNAASGLAIKRAVLIGAGSLGGEVAVLLARAGVGRLVLVDNDVIEAVNIGRHVLGAGALGEFKVNALRDRILRDIPTVDVIVFPKLIQLGGARLEEEFAAADIVVITTADWPSEEYIWHKKSAGASWSIVHAWSEPYGLVGHAFVAPPGASDARAFFDGGRFKHRFSHWPNDGVFALPACGASYIPGGPIGLARIAGMTAQITVEALLNPTVEPRWRFSVGQLDQLDSGGGSYTGPALGDGARFMEHERLWPDESE